MVKRSQGNTMDGSSMIILEAKDMAAEKMANKKNEEVEEEVEEDEDESLLLSDVSNLLDSWDDTEHQYYLDLTEVYDRHKGEEEEEVFEEEFEEE